MADNPFDQFDVQGGPPASTATNPFDQFDAKAPTVQQRPGPPQSMIHDIGNVIDQAATLGGADWLTSKAPGAPSLADLQATTQASSARVPAPIRVPFEVAGYIAGPGKILGPAGEAIGTGAVSRAAAEGALAGGASGAFGSNFDPGSIAANAAGGAALGGIAGALPKGINKVLDATLSKPGTVDPAAAIAKTSQDTTAAYAALHRVPANPMQIDRAIGGVMGNLDPSVETGMSPGLKNTINNIRTTIQGLPEANMGQVDSWQRQIKEAARREAHPTDGIVAGKIDSALGGLIPSDLQRTAKTAFEQSKMAENLADWTRQTQAGASIGQAPLTEAEKFYQGQPDKYKTLVDLYKTNQGIMDPSYSAGHMGGIIGATVGHAVLGFPGSVIGYPLGQYLTKNIAKKAVGKIKAGNMMKQIMATYPEMTGVQLTGGTKASQLPPQIGEVLKNAMIGSAF